MKKVLLLLTIVIICISVFCTPAFAEEDAVEKLEDEVMEQISKLDLTEFERFVKSIDNSLFEVGIRDFLKKLLNGEEVLTFSKVVEVFGGSALKEATNSIPLCASIILICILSNTLSKISSKITGNATENIVKFVCLAAIIVLLSSSIVSVAKDVKEIIEKITQFMNVIFPIMITLLTVIGGKSSVGIFSPYLTIMSSVLVNGLNSIILPMFFTCFIISVIGCLSDSVKLEGIRKFFKTFCDWLLGLGFGVFSTFLGGQAMISGCFDNMTVKATKFALNSYVPILGGYLSDGFDIVLSGSLLIKNAVGVTGIFIVFSIILMPLIKLVVLSLTLKLTSAFVQTIAEKRVSEMLNSVSSVISMLIALLLGTAFVFFFVLLLMVYTVNAGVI